MWVKSRLFIPISTMIGQSKIIISIIFRYSCLRFDRPFPTEYLRPQRVLIVEVLGSGIRHPASWHPASASPHGDLQQVVNLISPFIFQSEVLLVSRGSCGGCALGFCGRYNNGSELRAGDLAPASCVMPVGKRSIETRTAVNILSPQSSSAQVRTTGEVGRRRRPSQLRIPGAARNHHSGLLSPYWYFPIEGQRSRMWSLQYTRGLREVCYISGLLGSLN